MLAQISKDLLLNLASEAVKARGGLTSTLRALCTAAKTEAGVSLPTMAPLSDALLIANPDQLKVLRATFGTVSLEVFGVRWGWKDGALGPSQGAGGRPAKTTEDKLRALIGSDGWKAVLSAVYTVAQQDAEAARELLAVVEVLAPTAK